ncbi:MULTISPECIES: HEAT repeat domain-containing protein [Micromonospora]|uniref:HEAT repeat domain-containing protein n=1 Tax=Micromonospora TaxID=1873 RepID=UPI001B39376B|nr:HEAT repeat domain-containing protein [Micromonospora sp. M61]MBQ0977954.1 HEAT repeat domain-containing protein [Micromonospora sp. M61]WTI22300.1 HEAT repeat domain-containing protein [Micromonospora zamorensis]
MIDSHGALEAVVRHAMELEDDYDDIAPTVTALATSGDTTLVPRLREVLDRFLDEGNFYGRDLIAGVLAGIEGVAALPVLLRASARDLGDDQDSLQAEIIELLHADRATSRRVVRDAATGDTPELRRVGLWALGFVVEAQDVELLAAAVTDADPEIRSMAVGSIPDPAGDDWAFGALVLALRDLNEQVRVSAASRLGYTGRVDAVAPLVALAADPTPRVRSMVAYALGRLGSHEATPALQRLLQDPDRPVRENAAEALGSVGGPAAVDTLLVLAADQDPQLRVQAAKALATAADSDPRVAPQLTMLARDGEAAVRAATLSGLASADGRPSHRGRLLVELADDPDPMVRQRVAVVARHLAPDAAPDILHRYTRDPNQTLRRLAATELDRLTNPTAR